jgi:uncharacterized protein YbjT (DUF2867 family)
MRLPVLGATGRTGGQLPAQALEQGHEISALTRHADGMFTLRARGDAAGLLERLAAAPERAAGHLIAGRRWAGARPSHLTDPASPPAG